MLSTRAMAQDIHFSQFYNVPMLQSPANTGLMSNEDFRLTAAYRNQWASIPVPFNTAYAAADFQILKNDKFSNWLGVGVYGFSDKAGDGNLSATQLGASVAYHLLLGENSMISGGFGLGYNTRRIDFSRLSFDVQWDGFTFDKSNPNGEPRTDLNSKYLDLSTGLNLAYFPNEMLYLKIGVSMQHLNMPKVSFVGSDSRLGLKPVILLDAILDFQNGWQLEPSAYYSSLKGSTEILAGATVMRGFSSNTEKLTEAKVMLGGYYRLGDAAIMTVGLRINQVQITSSYDFTVSSLSQYNQSRGAFELSLTYHGFYTNSNNRMRSPFQCPRF